MWSILTLYYYIWAKQHQGFSKDEKILFFAHVANRTSEDLNRLCASYYSWIFV
jgi:hypothetical protein